MISDESKKIIKEMLNNPEPIIRERSIEAFNTNDVKELVSVIAPLLDDPIKSVRITAANKLAYLEKENFTDKQYKSLNKAFEEYLSSINYTSRFPLR
ncbi:MAG: hypothetical protein MZV64_07320 [Ignavibacteriales bacterium]|nr:hypothetical protein [Ignavibacteriales bacterium]